MIQTEAICQIWWQIGPLEVGATGSKSTGSLQQGLDKLSAMTFSLPGMCRAWRVTSFLENQVRIRHRRAHRRPAVAMSTVLFKQRSWNSFRARETR